LPCGRKAIAHAVSGAHELAALAERAEKHRQANGVRKDLRPGSKVHYRPAGPNAGAYKCKQASCLLYFPTKMELLPSVLEDGFLENW
jgi:hypothetical protein